MSHVLEVKNIFKDYGDDSLPVKVLKDISFNLDEGDYIAIMGPSGSGKTTLMNILGCLDRQTSGSYILDGIDTSEASDDELSDVRLNKVGFVFQTFQLLAEETALENVALPLIYAGIKKKERKERATKALEDVGLGDRLDFKPSQLSGGQKQRCAIARAMINHPKILLADEPTGALDSESGKQVMELFKELNEQGVTIIMITHDANVAANAKRIFQIIDGEIKLDEIALENLIAEKAGVDHEDIVFEEKAEDDANPETEEETADAVPEPEEDISPAITEENEDIPDEYIEEAIPEGRIALQLNEWICPVCHKLNNLHFCGGCGARRPADAVFHIDESAKPVINKARYLSRRRTMGYANMRKRRKANIRKGGAVR